VALLQSFRTVLLLALATALTLTLALAGSASAQLPDCPPDFPLCELDPREDEEPGEDDDPADDGFDDGGFDDGGFDDGGFDDDPQVTATPEGAVAAGTGGPLSGSTLPLLVLVGTLGLATVVGVAARRRFATDA
jgi:hypothetical protein